MGRKHRSVPEENHNDKEKALRQKVKQLEKEIVRLKGELKTLNAAFSKTSSYIKGNLDGITVEKIIVAAREEKTMIQIQKENVCPDCGQEIKTNKLPFGTFSICTAACGWKLVKRDGSQES